MISYVFKRYELKYLLTKEQYNSIKAGIAQELSPDAFGRTTIQSLYYDTQESRLIRESLEKPIFKEKLRLRCYGLNDCYKDVYLEMKRKYGGVVYKRRIACKENEAGNLLHGSGNSQIEKELAYFFRFYSELAPKMLILYDREAFCDPGSDLRVTFDSRVRYRISELNLHTSLDGDRLLPEGTVLMELKTGTAFPLWLCDLLSREAVQKQSFSKYGAAYELECRKTTKPKEKILCLNPFSATEALPLSTSLSS